MIDLPKGYKGCWHGFNYGDVSQQWLLVFSQQAYDREIKMLDKNMLKQAERSRKAFKQVMTKPFACEVDAMNFLSQWVITQQSQKVVNVSIRAVG